MEAILAAIAAWAWLVYFATFAAVFTQSMGAPVPGLTFVVLAAGLAGQGTVSLWGVAAAAVAGGALGGPTGYYLGSRGGRKLLVHAGPRFGLSASRRERAEAYVKRHGEKVLLFARYLPVLCFAGSLIAGASKMPAHRFAAYNLAGISLWASTHIAGAYLVGGLLGGIAAAT
jgi:membrane protein DedA with SNARE-associated domain